MNCVQTHCKYNYFVLNVYSFCFTSTGSVPETRFQSFFDTVKSVLRQAIIRQWTPSGSSVRLKQGVHLIQVLIDNVR